MISVAKTWAIGFSETPANLLFLSSFLTKSLMYLRQALPSSTITCNACFIALHAITQNLIYYNKSLSSFIILYQLSNAKNVIIITFSLSHYYCYYYYYYYYYYSIILKRNRNWPGQQRMKLSLNGGNCQFKSSIASACPQVCGIFSFFNQHKHPGEGEGGHSSLRLRVGNTTQRPLGVDLTRQRIATQPQPCPPVCGTLKRAIWQ